MIYECAKVPYISDCEQSVNGYEATVNCISIDLESTNECGFNVLGQIGIIAILIGVVSWAATNMLGLWTKTRKKLHLTLSIISLLLLVIGAIALGIGVLAPSLITSEAMGITLFAGLIVGIVGMVLALVTWVIEKVDTKAAKK